MTWIEDRAFCQELYRYAGAIRWSVHRPRVFFQPLQQFGRLFFALADGAGPGEFLILMDGPLDPAAGADHRAVIPLTHPAADLGETELGRLADQEHRHAAGEADRPLAPAGHQVFVLQAEVGADRLQDVLRLDRRDELAVQVTQGRLRGRDV